MGEGREEKGEGRGGDSNRKGRGRGGSLTP